MGSKYLVKTVVSKQFWILKILTIFAINQGKNYIIEPYISVYRYHYYYCYSTNKSRRILVGLDVLTAASMKMSSGLLRRVVL